MDYEYAISLCGGYGRYQIKLFLILFPVALTFVFGVSSMSYVMPAAVCDFQISKYLQGLIFSAIYLGMIPSGAIWGSVSDVIGRKKTLILTTGISGVFELLSSFSPNYWFLFACKFLAGCAVAGVHLTYYVYLSEFTDIKNKDSITMLSGATAALGYFVQPALAYFVIPLKFEWVLVNDWISFTSWKIFLVVSAVPPLLGFLICCFCIDETPKFLLITDRKEESLKIMKDIYKQNSGQPVDTFPVEDLVLNEDKTPTTAERGGSGVAQSVTQVTTLFKYPYLIPALMSFAAQIITMGAFNAIRPYTPILFSLALGFGQDSNGTAKPETLPFCVLFQSQHVFQSSVKCDEDDHANIDPTIFICSVIVGACVFISFFPFKKLVNVLGKVVTFVLAHVISAVCIFMFPFSTTIYGVIIICVYSICMQNSLTIVIGLMIARTPTTMRGIAVSLVMVFGRIGVVLGNQILPVITNLSCKAGFWTIAFVNMMSVPIMLVFSRQPNPIEELAAKQQTESARKASQPSPKPSTP